ncbi:MAG: AAA family ATPase [bacterium]|nr:AAA family ATPase [bacterium]
MKTRKLAGLDEHIQFVFITGVSKFSKVSVFSDLNNLMDITIDEEYSTMMGYTQEELSHYFADRLEQLATAGNGTRREWEQDIKKWYNGYSWDGKRFVYNPFSVLNFFRKKQFGNYWFESGTPSLMIKLIRRFNIEVEKLENYRAGEAVFSSFEIDRLHVVSLLFQTGYLTIKQVEEAEKGKRIYTLSYPNIEVRESFLEYLLGD